MEIHLKFAKLCLATLLILSAGCASENIRPSHLGQRTAYLLGDVVVPSKGYRLCKDDGDCIMVDSDCATGCGRVSINRRWSDEFRTRIEPVCLQEWKGQMCASAECRARTCPNFTPTCDHGLCTEPEEHAIPDLDPGEVTE